jgi:RimJ/RimL family protein N-acetyltransferase
MTDWYAMPVLSGRYVWLEPVGPEHASGLLEAADDDAVFQHLSRDRLRSLDDAAAFVAWARDLRERRQLMPFAQLDVRDGGPGVVAGHTSYYEIQPETRSIAIGYTWLGKRWWRSGLNTESKLLLLEHAFDTLGAVRVVWHTDLRNDRSQAAIARLGAEREGVLRKHKLRRDGTWRDTVQFAMTDDDWPGVRARLSARLEAA